MALPSIVTPSYELELPSTKKKIKYRPFLVKEEKILLLATESEEKNEVKEAVKTIVKNCVQSRIKIDELTSFDLEYLFLKIRTASVGEDVPMKITCMDDGETRVDYNVDISKVEVYVPENHTNKIMLTDTVGIIMKYPGLNEFVDITLMGNDIETPDETFEMIADCIDQIFEGEEVFDSTTTSKQEKISFIESLTQKQFEKIKEFFMTMPVLRHEFEVKNPKTGVVSTYTLEGLQSFFA
ncbi:baseplate hub subunit [Synechococcus phage S-PM2]|uniref:Baseplate hub subunit n=1 Tax=Synechococcus phage S-PM2 TaxID=238854 RepID=Q5GQD2_BPSYP|nr:baseplate hub [Synechococcus phage S-PM2]CAF34270.1 baseplate hub subunit [Synechococcus phage S-PM2]CFW42429.1 baseplate hub subunit [Synechococcus phage S-PM2]